MEKRYTSSEVRAIFGVSKNTLINWEANKWIPKPKRDPMNNWRYWTADDLKKLKKITGRG